MHDVCRILLVDDHKLLMEGIRSLLAPHSHLRVAGMAPDGKEAVGLAATLSPDLVIMDITMPNMDGLEALKAIRGKNGSANVVMCSAMGQESMVMDAVRSGAKDFIVKPFKPDRVLKTVTAILGG